MAHLIAEFNNLGGTSISKHKQNFSLYTKKLQALAPNDRIHVLDNLKAIHRQEELFLTELLLRFEHKDKLKEVILFGDRILNKLIISHKPFVFRDYDVNFFMNELFPNVSYVIRNKCINNLASIIDGDDVGEVFFKCMLERYGIQSAVPLLTVCSLAFIRDVVTQFRIMFAERHLVKLHERFGLEFTGFYYVEICKYGKDQHFADQPFFARYLSIKDIQSFHHLLQYGLPNIGKKGFVNFVTVYKDQLISDPTTYGKIIKRKILYRQLTSDEFKQYFLNTFAKKSEDFNLLATLDDLKMVRIGERGALLAETYRKKYGYDIWSISTYYVEPLFKILTLEERLKFPFDEDAMVEFYAPQKAFALIKDKINLTSDINSRCALVLKLVKCAKYNNDDNALLEALKYICQRHKNDNSSVRQDLFRFLNEKYDMTKLSSDIWKHITELVLSEELATNFLNRDMLEQTLNYKFVNGLDISDDFKRYVKYIGYHYFVLPSGNKELKKWALLKLPEVCAEVFTDEEALKMYPHSFLNILQYWNRENPKDVISYYKYPDLIDVVMKNYEGSYYDDLLAHTIMMYTPTDPKERLKQTELFNHFERFVHYEKLWRWMLKNRTELLEKHVDLIFNKKSNIMPAFFYELHKLHYTSMPGKVRAKALDILKNQTREIYVVKNALTSLSYEKDFMQIIKDDKYYPSGDAEATIDVHQENIKEIVQIREHILDCFKNRVYISEIIEPLLRFCYKDYFQRALPTLTFALYSCPEKDLCKPITVLQDRSVTVRKRALFFSTTLCNAETTCEALKHAGETERNKSLQKFIFNRTFKAFCNISNQASFDLLVKHFKFVFEKDTETREMVFSINLIPRKYVCAYIELVWNQIGKKWENEHNRLLNAINADVMPLLSDALCDDIIQFNLLHSKQQLVSSDVDFIYRYLVSSGDKIDHRFTLVSNNARVVADENSLLGFKEFNKKTRNIWFLYSDICRRLIKDKQTDIEKKQMLLDTLIAAFPNLPLPYNHLDYQLKVDICKCYLENEAGLPAFFIKLQKDVIDQHGDMMFDYFNECAKEQLHLISNEHEYWMNFIQKLLDHDNSTLVKMLAIKLMPHKYSNNETHALHFRNLIEKIESNAAPIVSHYLNKFLKSVNF